MSKIYEALLRAELDRIAAGQPPTPGFAEHAAAVVDTAEPAPMTTAPAVRAEDPGVLQSLQASAPGVFVAGDFSKVSRHHWVPAKESLPSLHARGPASEQFRRLRSRLFEYRGFNQLKTLLVSSAGSEEGKTFVSANLAISLSKHRNTRVLLIDGDLRRYSLQNYFGATASPGLGDYLKGNATPEQIVQLPDAATVAATSDLARIAFIPGGGGLEQEGDLSGRTKFDDLIRWASPHFDWIIVDSSPVGIVSDAVNLARSCDGVLLVVRSGVTKYELAQRAQSEFQSSNLIGVVLNGADKKPGAEYYGYSHEESRDGATADD